MCGFVVEYNPEKRKHVTPAELKRMCDLVAHRGPDHYGEYHDPRVSMGHRRLSIIDLSNSAHQPMRKGNFVIVSNGEIYNYVELRKELSDEFGAKFTTTSDTEVLLEAYACYGPGCLEKLNGMFCFLVWNIAEQELFVARDRLGVKPLFTARNGGSWLFASDIKSLWEVISPSGNLNRNAIYNYFSQSYISECESSTFGIEKYPQAHYSTFRSDGEKRHKYWDLNAVEPTGMARFSDVVDEAEDLLTNAIDIRLRSDVPLGCFLSGGVDSSLVTAIASRRLGRSFHTYSIGFDRESHDESNFAYRVASRYGTQHTHVKLDDGAIEHLPQIIWKYSELFGDSSAVPSYFVSQAAREHLTVVLTGDGGDEAFGGYVDPFAVYLSGAYARVPRMVRQGLSGLARYIGKGNSHYLFRWIRRFNDITDQDVEDVYKKLKSGSWGDCASGMSTSYLRSCTSSCDVSKLLYADINDRLCYDFLVKVDMATMAHSLEARSPFLDYRVMEYGYSMCNKNRFKKMVRKAVLKKIAEKYLDRDIVYRKKMGFSIPKYEWLSDRSVFATVKRLIGRKSALDDFLKREWIEQVIGEFEAGRVEHANRIWLLLWFQIWEGVFVSRIYNRDQMLTEL